MSDETVGPTCPGLCKKADPLGQPKAVEGRAVAAPLGLCHPDTTRSCAPGLRTDLQCPESAGQVGAVSHPSPSTPFSAAPNRKWGLGPACIGSFSRERFGAEGGGRYGPRGGSGFGGVRPAWGCPWGHAGLRVWRGARPWAWETRSPDAPPQPRCSPGTPRTSPVSLAPQRR